MSDLIDRQKALDGLAYEMKYGAEIDRCGLDTAYDVIENMPSAEPERKWIPFEVALPNDRQKVLCVNKKGEMMVGGYLTDYGMTFPCYFEKPVAWMPLPEPWRGDR